MQLLRKCFIPRKWDKVGKQAGAELGQAQLQLELELSLTDLRFLALS